jgi:hypothetical protein
MDSNIKPDPAILIAKPGRINPRLPKLKKSGQAKEKM